MQFTKTSELELSRATFLEKKERFIEAAEQHLEGNRPLAAIRLFRRDPTAASQQYARSSAIDALWRNISLQGKSDALKEETDALVEVALGIIPKTDSLHDEVNFVISCFASPMSYSICLRH